MIKEFRWEEEMLKKGLIGGICLLLSIFLFSHQVCLFVDLDNGGLL